MVDVARRISKYIQKMAVFPILCLAADVDISIEYEEHDIHDPNQR